MCLELTFTSLFPNGFGHFCTCETEPSSLQGRHLWHSPGKLLILEGKSGFNLDATELG